MKKFSQGRSSGDWGTLWQSDIATNQAAIQLGGCVFSSYAIPPEMIVVVISYWLSISSDLPIATLRVIISPPFIRWGIYNTIVL